MAVIIKTNNPDKLLTNIKQQIDQPATDLASVTTNTINPNKLLGLLLKNLAEVLNDFEQHGFTQVRDEWTKHHAYHLKPVKMLHPDGRETIGNLVNVAEDGILLVSTALGEQRFSSGEISLRAAE